jgi:hypothetical protein
MAPYPVSVGERIDAGLAMKAGTAAIDSALSQVAGLRDPNQAGGRKRKTKKAKKAKKSHRKSKKTQRKAKKSHRKSKKTQRKSKKSRKQCGGKAKKSHRKSKKSRKQRGGQMDYAESMKGGIIDADLLAKAGLHDSWKSVAAGNVM